jgi:hypothetical protein
MPPVAETMKIRRRQIEAVPTHAFAFRKNASNRPSGDHTAGLSARAASIVGASVPSAGTFQSEQAAESSRYS